jgi:hypothetical protein
MGTLWLWDTYEEYCKLYVQWISEENGETFDYNIWEEAIGKV